MDFTLKKYEQLLIALKNQDYTFQTFGEFLKHPSKKVIILRHDVEKRVNQSLKFAELEDSLNIKGSYYFRYGTNKINLEVVKEIAGLNHEVGYHYDDLSACKGDYEKAISRFKSNLIELRSVASVETICMDGSPMSKYDNRLLWDKYHYRDFGIIGEPYIDINFNSVLYLTDTGRKWNGHKVSFRDKINTSIEKWIKDGHNYRATNDIINAVNENAIPDQILITIHPQRWSNNHLCWTVELVGQRLKNIAKRLLISFQKHS